MLFGDDKRKEEKPSEKDAKSVFEYAYKYLKVNEPVAKVRRSQRLQFAAAEHRGRSRSETTHIPKVTMQR